MFTDSVHEIVCDTVHRFSSLKLSVDLISPIQFTETVDIHRFAWPERETGSIFTDWMHETVSRCVFTDWIRLRLSGDVFTDWMHKTVSGCVFTDLMRPETIRSCIHRLDAHETVRSYIHHDWMRLKLSVCVYSPIGRARNCSGAVFTTIKCTLIPSGCVYSPIGCA